MREAEIEARLTEAVKQRGGLSVKFLSTIAGLPDRILFMPNGKLGLVELKQKGQKPRVLQRRRHLQLESRGFHVYILDDPADIPRLLDEIEGVTTDGV